MEGVSEENATIHQLRVISLSLSTILKPCAANDVFNQSISNEWIAFYGPHLQTMSFSDQTRDHLKTNPVLYLLSYMGGPHIFIMCIYQLLHRHLLLSFSFMPLDLLLLPRHQLQLFLSVQVYATKSRNISRNSIQRRK